MIEAPSPWEGQLTPNLNGEERFLRGGLDDVQLQTEEDSLQAHTHGISDPGHGHGYTDRWSAAGNLPAGFGPCCGDTDAYRFDQPHSDTTSSGKSNIEVTGIDEARSADETRPKNIRVVYIMKVF